MKITDMKCLFYPNQKIVIKDEYNANHYVGLLNKLPNQFYDINIKRICSDFYGSYTSGQNCIVIKVDADDIC